MRKIKQIELNRKRFREDALKKHLEANKEEKESLEELDTNQEKDNEKKLELNENKKEKDQIDNMKIEKEQEIIEKKGNYNYPVKFNFIYSESFID